MSVVPPLNKPGISASAHGKTDQAIPSFPAQTDGLAPGRRLS